jgi:hypothetical protein
VAPKVANDRLIELVAGDADRSPDDDTTKRDDRYVGRSAPMSTAMPP